jgi:mRNA interferase HigB
MHIVSLKILRLFWQVHPDAEQAMRAWFEIANKSQWRTPADIKALTEMQALLGTIA